MLIRSLTALLPTGNATSPKKFPLPRAFIPAFGWLIGTPTLNSHTQSRLFANNQKSLARFPHFERRPMRPNAPDMAILLVQCNGNGIIPGRVPSSLQGVIDDKAYV
jgi:hypothetical protein